MHPTPLPAPQRLLASDAAGIAACKGLLQSRAAWLRDQGIGQWLIMLQEPEATEIIAHRVQQHEVYLWTDTQGPLATICLQHTDELVWGPDNGQALYLHGLATRLGSPGVGALVMQWAEAQAIARRQTLLRLDCVANNPKLLAYYRNLGFQDRGGATPYGPEWPIRRWEKQLKL